MSFILEPIDYDRLMKANLMLVFNEHDTSKRLAAIKSLYKVDAVFKEAHASFKGHALINQAITDHLNRLPRGFVFSPQGAAIGHHNIGRLKWVYGPPDGPIIRRGMDIIHFEDNLIHSFFVFIDP